MDYILPLILYLNFRWSETNGVLEDRKSIKNSWYALGLEEM